MTVAANSRRMVAIVPIACPIPFHVELYRRRKKNPNKITDPQEKRKTELRNKNFGDRQNKIKKKDFQILNLKR